MKCGTWHAIKKHDTTPAQVLLGQAHLFTMPNPVGLQIQWGPNNFSYPWIICNKEEVASLPSVLQLFRDLTLIDKPNIAKTVGLKKEKLN